MATFNVHKGVDKPIEFKGLQSQYLFIFAGGVIVLLIGITLMVMVGIDQTLCIGIAVLWISVLTGITFHLNRRYGEYGLMKLAARKRCPRRIVCNKNIQRLIKGH